MSTRPEFRSSIVQQLLADIFYERSNLYYFLGKLDTWSDEDNPPDTVPSTLQEDVNVRDNILYLRKITPNDVSLVTKNNPWVYGTVYAQWDHTLDVRALPFFVITPDFNVYKCLSNNNGVASTVMPSGASLFPFTTSDGYLWKYMYNVPVVKRRKFISQLYIPAQRALTDSFYSKGAIEQIVITDGGSGYVSDPVTTVEVGAPSGSGTTAVISLTISGGSVTTATVVSGGSNYLFPPKITVSAPVAGNVAELTATISGGAVTAVTIVDPGSGYTIAPTPTVEAPRVQAEITVYVNPDTGEIDSAVITNAGAGYATTPTVSVVDDSGSLLVSGKYPGNTTAVIVPYMYQGRIDRIAITDPGINYSADTATTLSIQGDGTGAKIYPKIEDGVIVGAIIADPGINYTYLDIEVVTSLDNPGTGAVLNAVIGASDFLSDQSQVEQTAVPGAIYAIKMSVGGTGYHQTGDLNPGGGLYEGVQVTITGDGTGATAEAVVVNGAITKVVMTSYGSGYTYATISFSDVDRLEPNSFVDAVGYAILPPAGGHGSNAIKELYADTIAISVLVKDDDELSALEQDYRQFGLLSNPLTTVTKRPLTQQKNFVTYEATLASVSGLAADDILVNSNKRYRIVDINLNKVILQQLHSIPATPSGYFTKEGAVGSQFAISSVSTTPTADKYSGELMYVSNTSPFIPTPTQSFVIRTYITL